MIRIVAGEAKGRKLNIPEGDNIRPTTDKVREAVFNSLFKLNLPQNKRVLDLFAGSGALGIEALSRGAEFVTFVDKEKSCIRTIHENLTQLGYTDRAEIIRFNSLEYVKTLDLAYDLVFMDPPYEFTGWPELLEDMEKSKTLVIESNKEIETDSKVWEISKSKKYSNSYIKVCINTQIA